MAVVGELLVLIAGNNAPLTAALASSRAEMSGFTAQTAAQGSVVGSVFTGMGLVAVGAGVAAAAVGAASLKAASDFQEQMAIINTIARQTPEQLNRTGLAIRQIAAETGTSLPDATKAFYDLLSAGISSSNAIGVLRQATTLSIGALSTTDQAVDLLTTAINAYGLNAKGAATATDQFALAVQDGKVTADQIAATFADIAPIARSAGIGIDEISASYAFLTARGLPAAEVTTQMNRAIVELLKPHAQLADLQKATGIHFAELAGQKGLVVALETMREAAARAHVPFQDLFGRIEAYKFALATTGPAFAGYSAELLKMGSATGTAADQMAERMGTVDMVGRRLGVTLNSIGISIGNALLPAFQQIQNAILPVLTSIGQWVEANPGLTTQILMVAGAVGALGLAILAVVPIIAALTGPIGLIALAIGAFGLAWVNNWGNIRAITAVVVGIIGGIIHGLGITVKAVADGITATWNFLVVVFNAVAKGIGAAVGLVSGIINGLLGVVSTVAKAIGDFFGWLFGNANQAHAVLAGLKPGGAAPAIGGKYAGALHPDIIGSLNTAGVNAATLSRSNVPVFQHGGVVGGVGPQLAVVHGGEEVIPAGGRSAPIVSERHIHIEVGGRELMEYIDRELFGSASNFSSGFGANPGVTGA